MSDLIMFLFAPIFLAVPALVIIIHCIVAKKFNKIAQQKGHYDVHAFAMCFWLGIIGYLYVIALPDLTVRCVYIINEVETKTED